MPGPIRSAFLFNSGVAIATDPSLAPDEVKVALSDAKGRPVAGIEASPVAIDDRAAEQVLLFRLDPGIFETSSRLRLEVLAGDHVHRSGLTTIGPGSYAGQVEAVEDYALTGWASPLFSTETFEIQLVVDGKAGPPVAPNLLRRDLMMLSGHGGWNGFKLALPPTALDGRPHRLAVRVGSTALAFGNWAAKPKFSIDHVERRRLTGWFYDAASSDVPATMRLMAREREVARLQTGFRTDIKSLFGRDAAAFAFVDLPIAAGQQLVAGTEGGKVIAQIEEETLLDRIDRLRGRARERLIAGASLEERRAIRAAIIEERQRPESRLGASEPGVPVGATLSGQPQAAAGSPRAGRPPVCLIVPVYKGLTELRSCLDSLLPCVDPGRVRLLVIDDASPEAEITAYLGALARKPRPGVTVLTNPRNLGFVGTVNRGFAELAPGEDVLLVNADAALPPGGLEKLAAICHGEPGIASVTPMSNNATILSFPAGPEPNPPCLGLDVGTLDAAFEDLDAAPAEIPTAIGFCMYINRLALDEVGAFSLEWGRGYGEEVDWSLTARDLGWRHLAATNTFVVHEGSVSFGVEERRQILADSHARLDARYPEYADEVRRFIAEDPLETLRCRVLARLLGNRFRRLVLHLMHGLGGGTQRYIDDLAKLPRSAEHELCTAMLTETFGPPRLHLSFDVSQASIAIKPETFEGFLKLLETNGVTVLPHLNSRLHLPSGVMDAIAAGPRPYVVTLHDYAWYCPKVHLTDERVFYCGEPPPEVCQLCVRHGESHDFRDHDALIQADIETWLKFNERILRGAAQVFAPSQDTADRYVRRLGLTNVVVRRHPEPAIAPASAPAQRSPRTGALRIAVVGAVGYHKGFELVVRMAEYAAIRRLPVYIRVVGYTPNGELLARLPNADVTGPYEPQDLKRHLDRFDPDFVFLSSVWPETYSYVLSEAWRAGYPVAAFDFGAPAERIRRYGGGVLIPPTRDAAEVLAALMAARGMLDDCRFAPLASMSATLEDYYSGIIQTA